MPVINPNQAQLAALAAASDDGPVVMVNLLAFSRPDGASAYARYAERVQPHLERVGGKALYVGAERLAVIGDDAEPWWDAILLVEYPSIAKFLEMVSDPDYQAVHEDRAVALERAELIATAPGVLTL